MRSNQFAALASLFAIAWGGGGEAMAAPPSACNPATHLIVPPGGSISTTIATALAATPPPTELSLCLQGAPSTGIGSCSNGTFYDNVSVSGIDLHIIPDPEPTRSDICIQNSPGGPVYLFPGPSCDGGSEPDHWCGYYGTGTTIRIVNSPTGSSIGDFTQIVNDRGTCAVEVIDSALTIDGTDYESPRIFSPGGLAFHAKGTSSHPGATQVELYGGIIEESTVGLVLHGDASFAANAVSIAGHTERAVEAMDQSSFLLVDGGLEDSQSVAWFCEDATADLQSVGIVNNPTPSATMVPGSVGIWLEDQATLDAFNVLAHTNDFTGNDVGLVYLQDTSELSLANSTFADNEATWEVQWIDSTVVDIVDTVFHDSTTRPSGIPATNDSLYCYTTELSTADHVNGYNYLHGTGAGTGSDGFGPFGGGTSVWLTSPNCQLTNNMSENPRFVSGHWNAYYLDQGYPSPMIDAGSDDAENIYDFLMGDWTTDPSDPTLGQPDPVSDEGTTVDIGYHQLPPS